MKTHLSSALSLVNVSLRYPDGDAGTVAALDGVNLTVNAGTITSVVGPSGSGKSSLLAVAATLVRPTYGKVIIGGVDATGLSDRERTRLRRDEIGIVFQQPNLLPSLMAVEQLLIGEHLRGGSPGAARSRALNMLDVVGLSGSARKRPHQLSGGQRQRVNIARALMGEPAVLLVDEPTAALDRARSESIVRLLCEVTRSQHLATVMVTHDTGFVPLTDAAVTMTDGVLHSPSPAQASAAAAR